MKILLIEDEAPKLEAIRRFISSVVPCGIDVARSIKSGVARLDEGRYDLVILDMSLPTFYISSSEPGGRPQGFGGMDIIRHMDVMDIHTATVVVSAYEAFSRGGTNVELRALAKELARDYPEIVRGVVYFNPVHGEWSEELADLVQSLANDVRKQP